MLTGKDTSTQSTTTTTRPRSNSQPAQKHPLHSLVDLSKKPSLILESTTKKLKGMGKQVLKAVSPETMYYSVPTKKPETPASNSLSIC